ncbi:hypothetical protein [Teredinibacter turnerae]|uniref:hypothetical protein n=1 Tax=Teredinibacter turnerae TaxID=2426 RepID=UPI0003673640|nr:hypothetical protein [Teredinibacter turnerae]
MIGIGSTNIYIDMPSLSREELEEYSTSLFEEWELYVQKNLNLSDYSLSLSVEDGSIKALGKIGVGLYALYLGIGQYGSFISGLKTIKNQVNSATDYLNQQSVAPFSDQRITPTVRKRGEALSKIERLIYKVENGEISADEAIEQSKAIFGDSDDVPEFYNDLEVALHEVPPHPSENQLEMELKSDEDMLSAPQKTEKRPKPSKPPLPPVDHYRVEVWRESRRDKLNVRVSKK